MSIVATTPREHQVLELILEHRLDRLDTAVRPAVAAILTAAEQLPPADRLHVHRRLRDLGRPSSTTGPAPSMTDDHLSARTRRRLARSPFAPIGEPVLRDDILARLLVERLNSLGPLTETEAIDVLDIRAPGRGADVVAYASARASSVAHSAATSQPRSRPSACQGRSPHDPEKPAPYTASHQGTWSVAWIPERNAPGRHAPLQADHHHRPEPDTGEGEIRHYPTMLQAANAFAKTEAPFKQVIFDDGHLARELNRREQQQLEDVCDMLGLDVEETG